MNCSITDWGQRMNEQGAEKMCFEVRTYGDPAAETFLIQMVDDHDLEIIEKEAAHIRELSGEQNFCLKAIKVNSWNTDLSPWPAPAVFGDEDFGDGAKQTLHTLLQELIPEMIPETFGKRIYLGGYSLAGLFALWAGYQTDLFDGIAAASPSIWFPRFTDYMRESTIRAGAVYLSLGDREERTGNPLMSQVGNAIRDAYTVLLDAGVHCTLEWNKGNHFKNPDLRMAKAFAWLMLLLSRKKKEKECCSK